jgi:S1-C subfamily serine protease
MKKLKVLNIAKLIGVLALVFIVYYKISDQAPTERYISLAAESTPKTVMIEVDTIMKRTIVSFDEEGLTIIQATVPVTLKGSGVLISSKGHVLTCGHLFDVGPYVSAPRVYLSDGHALEGIVLNISHPRDLALLKIQDFWGREFPYAILSNGTVKAGQEVMAIGNPLGLPFTITTGIISAINRDIEFPTNYNQMSAPINPGNSGGPLFNLSGELVGINTLKQADGEGLGFSVTIQTIKEYIDQFKGL